MGNGPKRRQRDVVIVKSSNAQKKPVGSEGSKGSSDSICPASFRLLIPSSKKLNVGVALSLLPDGGVIYVIKDSERILTLRSSRSQQLLNCLKTGFRYIGKVVSDDGGKKYAEFIRKT